MADELQLLREILPTLRQRPDVVVPPGDDCAAIDSGGTELLLAAVDQLIGDVHYYRQRTEPERIGAKLLKRNLIDIAAMGGRPAWALLTLALGGVSDDWLKRFYAGLEACARRYNVAICGGDLAALPPGIEGEVGTLTILGQVERTKLCRRTAARDGELLLVTGELGNSLASEHHLDFQPRLAEGAFLAGDFTRCMMDISDGLLLDAQRLAEQSKTGIVLDTEALPLRSGANTGMALGDGEDYELLFTLPPEQLETLQNRWPFATRLSVIGRIAGQRPGTVVDRFGNHLSNKGNSGYVHFQ